MGVAYYPVFKPKLPGKPPMMNGKAFAAASERVEAAAVSLKIPPLIATFFSVDPEELRAVMEESGTEAPDDLQPEAWHPVEAGLNTVTGLVAHFTSDETHDNRTLIADLTTLRDLLLIARSSGSEWHLAIDY